MEETVFDSAETNAPSNAARRTFAFTCVTGIDEWRIDYSWGSAEEKWAFDGTNLISSLLATAGTPKHVAEKVQNVTHLKVGIPDPANPVATIRVTPSTDGLPMGETSAVNLPWLVFCSGNYLARTDRRIPSPFGPLAHFPEAFGYTDETETFNDALRLPRSVKLFTSNFLRAMSVTNFNKRYLNDRMPSIYPTMVPDVTVALEYTVTKATNIAGWSVPLEFRYSSFAWQHTYKPTPVLVGVGRVSSAVLTTNIESIFAATHRKTVIDNRVQRTYRGPLAIHYSSTNSFLEPTNSPTVMEAAHRLEARIASSPKPN